MLRGELEQYLDGLLKPALFRDYCPNGLQVEGRTEVKKIATGVTASQKFIDAAIAAGADTLLVHHGYFWRGEDERVIGMKQRRLKALLTHELNLIAYHLPLDAHAEFGNNAQLAKRLGITISGTLERGNPAAPGNVGQLDSPLSAAEFSERIARVLKRPPLHIAGSDRMIQNVAFCTGAAQDFIVKAAELGADAYLSGEISERTVHEAEELGLHYFACGHHATERYGAQSLGEHLAERFGLDVVFLDIENPV
ncbi:MAG TPA: Nif3-like dinuclear metal center hexameric protein [Pseudomonadales bacterium]|nr:Nif3-like dinuclear metal center hexameric protein [Pseudomonadales bacterium]